MSVAMKQYVNIHFVFAIRCSVYAFVSASSKSHAAIPSISLELMISFVFTLSRPSWTTT